jgi:anti-sigma B factor antagonist
MKTFRIDRQDDTLFLRLQGEFTFGAATELRQAAEEALDSPFWAMVVDLSHVPFMDSTGIGTLVAINSKVYAAGRRFALLSPGERVLKTLELVRLQDFFIIARDEEELELKLAEAP